MLTLRESCALAGVPYTTWAKWVSRWRSMDVDGIEVVKARARSGRATMVHDDFVDRWLRCELPSPYRFTR